MLRALPEDGFNRLVHGCFDKTDALRAEAGWLASQQLGPPAMPGTVPAQTV